MCAVTSLPVQPLVGDIQQGTYRWRGPIVNNHQGAGLLVHKSLRCAIVDQAAPQDTANRMAVIHIGGHVIQSVHSPFVGKYSMEETKK